VPVVAIFSVGATQDVREQVGIGAILGAPLMLSTLVLFLLAAFAVYRRGWRVSFIRSAAVCGAILTGSRSASAWRRSRSSCRKLSTNAYRDRF